MLDGEGKIGEMCPGLGGRRAKFPDGIISLDLHRLKKVIPVPKC